MCLPGDFSENFVYLIRIPGRQFHNTVARIAIARDGRQWLIEFVRNLGGHLAHRAQTADVSQLQHALSFVLLSLALIGYIDTGCNHMRGGTIACW